ncbi:MAG: Fic family protein [Sphingobacteriales bacterium]
MPALAETIAQIDQQVKVLQKLQPLKPEDQQRLDKKFRLEFNYNSNHLEGNTLTYGETELLLIFDKTTGDHDKREYDEMEAHDVALRMIQEEAADIERPLTEQFVRQLNTRLLVKPFWKEAETPGGQKTSKEIIPGQYKSLPNSVRLSNGEIFHYALPQETPAKMQELITWYNNSKEHPLLAAAMLHYNFVRIHPFDDGNGRVSRLLMNYVLLKNNLPLIVIKSSDKKNYLTALNKADVGDTAAFINYIGEQLLWSLDLIIKAAKGEDIEEPDDLDKKIAVLSKKINKKEESKKKSSELLQILLQKSIHPFLDELTNYLEKFKEFYDNINYSFTMNGSAHYGNDYKQFKDSSLSILRSERQNLNNLSIQFTLSGFKHDMYSGYQSNGNLQIIFDVYRYGFESENIFHKYWSYDHQLNEKDRKFILNYIGSRLYEDIEHKVNHVNSKS